MLQAVFGVGSEYFPESIWKIYVINTPLIFRAGWAMVKGWVHPITQAKINIFGSPADARKVMLTHGLNDDALPAWLGGTHPGKPTFEYLKETIANNCAGAAAAAGGASAAATSMTLLNGEPGVEVAAAADRIGPLASV